jgi:lipopolysaccharide export system protein LptA
MPLKISRLRFWFGAGAVAVCAVVAGAYFYGRSHVENALKEVPGKIGVQIQQTAEGFTISKSEAGHTLFRIQASRAIKYKIGGRVELHDVVITVYGRDSNHFDRISGDDFSYDPQSGDVTAQGNVTIDLGANPAELENSDHASSEFRNPIHLKTSGLVFNQKTGNAHTANRVEFSIAQANGSALGADYTANSGTLKLLAQIELTGNGPDTAQLTAQSASVDKNSRTITFFEPHIERTAERFKSQKAVLFLRDNNTADRIFASGNIYVESTGKEPASIQAGNMDLQLAHDGKTLSRAILSGGVTLNSRGDSIADGTAQRVELNFAGKSVLTSIHADGDVKLQEQQPSQKSATAQQFAVAAPALDLTVADGRRLRQAMTIGPSQIVLLPAKAKRGQEIVVDGGQFLGKFNASGQLTSLHGDQHTRVVSHDLGQPGRVSSSDMLDATMEPDGGIKSFAQKGHLVYSDGTRKAWANEGRYTPADQLLVLTGSPRVADAGVTTTADTMKLNRATGEASATGDVKTTYSDLKAQAHGALLASSSPIHVTAQNMTARNSPAIAVYTGNVRLWQDANVVQAPRVQFDRDHRDILASGSSADPVSTVLVQTDDKGKVMPVTITSPQLAYTSQDNEIQLKGGVTVKGADAVLRSEHMTLFLENQGESVGNQAGLAGKVEKVVAQGGVVVRQEGRKATGSQLTYTPADGKFIITGNSPSIFDAEHGKITGVSLTFFGRDDTVLVEGSGKTPTVTRARVAR